MAPTWVVRESGVPLEDQSPDPGATELQRGAQPDGPGTDDYDIELSGAHDDFRAASLR
jgi:hypothetical protein